MKIGLIIGLLLLPLSVQARQHHLLIVSGLGGVEAYRQQFAQASMSLLQSAIKAGFEKDNIIVLTADPSGDPAIPHRLADKTAISQALQQISTRAGDNDRIFVVLIGHGNPRGDSAVFNLPGPDISAEEFAAAVAVLDDRSTIIINTASASGPFIKPLSRDNRVVITATSSGREYHATLFGDYFIAAFAEAGADRDKDERISVLEAFDYARREVQRNFESEKRLSTEHALLDDNGDGLGSSDPGEFQVDGALANRIYLQQPWSLANGASSELIEMLNSKQGLEQSIQTLKRQRDSMTTAVYYTELERLLVELALLAREIKAQGG